MSHQTDQPISEVLQDGVYQHYKGKFYLLLGLGEHTETGEVCVVYVPLYQQPAGSLPLRVRPLRGTAGFSEEVLVDGKPRPRFTFMGTRTTS